MQQKEHAGQMSGTIDTLSGQGYDSYNALSLQAGIPVGIHQRLQLPALFAERAVPVIIERIFRNISFIKYRSDLMPVYLI